MYLHRPDIYCPHRRMGEKPTLQCHAGVGGDIFARESDFGFSLANDCTGMADFAILFSHPFGDLLSRRWSAINFLRSL